jgi:hypothetical protein
MKFAPRLPRPNVTKLKPRNAGCGEIHFGLGVRQVGCVRHLNDKLKPDHRRERSALSPLETLFAQKGSF